MDNCGLPCVYPNDVFVATLDNLLSLVNIMSSYMPPKQGLIYMYNVYSLNVHTTITLGNQGF